MTFHAIDLCVGRDFNFLIDDEYTVSTNNKHAHVG